jgi:two-component system phosphate regulon sensor histidine kinase PhoR
MDISKRASPVKLLALFVLLAGVPLVALGWLGWQLVARDRALDAQRIRERLENAAALVAAELDRSLITWDSLLPAAARRDSVLLPANAVFLLFDSRGVLHQQGIRLPYYPAVYVRSADDAALFADAEMQEFGLERNLPKALAAYRALAGSRDKSVRGAALMRLARALRQDQRVQEALAAYGELAALSGTPVAGSPAELLGRRERLALLRAIRDEDGAAREAALLTEALSEGRFLIDRATYDFFKESLPGVQPLAAEHVAATRFAIALEELWPKFLQHAGGRAAWTIEAETAAFAAVWQRTTRGTAVIVGAIDDVLAPAREITEKLGVRVTLQDSTGRAAWGTPPASDGHITRSAAETGLPWTMHVTLVDRSSIDDVASSRRRLFGAGFALMVLIMAAAGYVVFRSVNRELTVARLQSDFVAAVSHEFRTPLTAMCHLTEMLEQGETPAERLPLYYRALGKESRRLHGMVESLLDFGRLESGRHTYELSSMDATEFVRRTVQEFRDQSGSGGHRVELLQPNARGCTLHIRADRDALTVAVRSLLDNAVKYSPAGSPVTVCLESRDGFVGIAIQDNGAGIPQDEQRAVFKKFTRGAAARRLNVKGTGIGLTMAAEIVKAHGGRLELVSEAGAGARFTIVLPAFAPAG